MSDHGNPDCLHCIILRLILDRARERRAAGVEHDTLEDIVRVTEVLAQLLGTNPDKMARDVIFKLATEMLITQFGVVAISTDAFVANRSAPSTTTKH